MTAAFGHIGNRRLLAPFAGGRHGQVNWRIRCRLIPSTRLYEALKEAGTSDEKAKAAASAIADYDKHFTHSESDLTDIKAEIKVLKIEINLV